MLQRVITSRIAIGSRARAALQRAQSPRRISASTPRQRSDALLLSNIDDVDSILKHEPQPTLVPNSFTARMVLTADIAVSKLFTGGFCWQAGSVIATEAGFKATDITLALATGVGDLLGVSLGHLLFSGIKSVVSGADFKSQVPIATWLGAAAFCSGTLWQPAVNFFAGLGLSFPGVFFCVGAVCGAAFFAGLRLGRRALSRYGVAPPTSHNLVEDAGLSVAIGGAAAMFVSTDVTIPKNSLDTVFGVTATMGPLEACARAGASTAAGFALVHTIQNSRASESIAGAYLTRPTFAKAAAIIGTEIVKENPATKPAVQRFLNEKLNHLFEKIDANGDGRLTPQELMEHKATKMNSGDK